MEKVLNEDQYEILKEFFQELKEELYTIKTGHKADVALTASLLEEEIIKINDEVFDGDLDI